MQLRLPVAQPYLERKTTVLTVALKKNRFLLFQVVDQLNREAL